MFGFAAVFGSHASVAAPQPKETLTCRLEQILLFADNPSDYPTGPAYFGSSQPLLAAKPDNHSFTDVEAEIIHTANSMVLEYRGAKFTVDLRDGTLKSIPFGDKGFLIITPMFGEPDKPVLLTKKHDFLAEGDAFIGYYAEKRKNYGAILMIEAPLINGERTFEYVATGETLLGYCD